MASEQKRKTRKKEVSPEKYRDFIEGIELENIFFAKGAFELLVPEIPQGETISVSVKERAELLKRDTKAFSIKHIYDLWGSLTKEKGHKCMEVHAEIIVEYSSKKRITNAIFDIFKKVNLPVNTWPYFREYVHNCTARFNLIPLVLPALKRP